MQRIKHVAASLLSAPLYRALYTPDSHRRLSTRAKSSGTAASPESMPIGGVPAPREAWEAQYARGEWGYMNNLDEQSRYSVIVGYLHQLKPGGAAILDVGCGEGLLFKRFKPYGYSRYVGIDIAQAAIDQLAPERTSQTVFLRAEAETYSPDGSFDAIVFNEVLYYLEDPLQVVKRYAASLSEAGIFIVNTYAGSLRAHVILKQLKANYPLLDEVRLEHRPKAWTISVFKR